MGLAAIPSNSTDLVGRLYGESVENLNTSEETLSPPDTDSAPTALRVCLEALGRQGAREPRELLLPRNLEAFEKRIGERAKLVAGLLAEGRRMVEEVERLVCALYDVPGDLTEEVVAHAVRRAGPSA